MMKNVLVLMATYNGDDYLEEQLTSLINQKDVNVSVLVRDDGSDDKTVDILKEWEKTYNIKWFVDNKHLGAGFGFLYLMKEAEKYNNIDYFAFCDQDDVWNDDKLKIACSFLEEIPDSVPGLYYCGQIIADKDLNLISVHRLNEDRNWFARFIFSDIAGCTTVFNKGLLKTINMYTPHYLLMHDTWMLKVCLATGGQVKVDSEAHIKYRQHGKNTVGLNNSLRNRLSRAKKYVFDYDVEKQVIELQKGYADKIIPLYQELVEWIMEYKKNRCYRKKLIDKKNVDFCDKKIYILFRIKILLHKL